MTEQQQIEELMQRRVRIAIGDLVLQLQQAQAVIEHLQARVTELEQEPVRRTNGAGEAREVPNL
jgi:hypothetical protein